MVTGYRLAEKRDEFFSTEYKNYLLCGWILYFVGCSNI